ncbi:hypothetical protein [Thomasclavelia sp.]|nr:hypothetical protein [Thomasclavelia sp.]
MEKHDINLSGRGILTITAGIALLGSVVAGLSGYLLDLIML